MPPWSTVEFAHSATRHGISREQSLHVVENAHGVYPIPAAVDPAWQTERLLFVGHDSRGVPLEVVAIELDDGDLLVIHAMKLRRSYRRLLGGAMGHMGRQ
jgi:hypothetical protein